jgi:hypothetical protein
VFARICRFPVWACGKDFTLDHQRGASSPLVEPLPQRHQPVGEFVLLLSRDAAVDDPHGERGHVGVEPCQLSEQLSVLPGHGVTLVHAYALFVAMRRADRAESCQGAGEWDSMRSPCPLRIKVDSMDVATEGKLERH